jgi:SAM-dependent methyltransferase
VERKLTPRDVRADFNEIRAVIHYTKAAHDLGLWESERTLIETYFTQRSASLVELGCGAGRVTLGLWALGFRTITAVDFAAELIEQAESLAVQRSASSIRFVTADVCARGALEGLPGAPFDGAFFLFNGLMQIPGRRRRRAAMANLAAQMRPGAPFLFTTHDREASAFERERWVQEQLLWDSGLQDPRLVEFGDRYFEDGTGRTFMHLPNRPEILEDLEATGWSHEWDAMRSEVATESRPVRDFSDECRFWLARRAPGQSRTQ